VDGIHSTGGSRELAKLLEEHGEVLVPELKERFGLDLRDVMLYDMSPRFVLVHIGFLPLGSAFVAELRGGPQFRGWDEDRYINVQRLNAARVANHLFVCANMDPKKKKPAPPEPYPIPDKRVKEDQSKKPGSFAAMAAQQMAAARKKKGVI
jgi:hypothetical protein